MPRKSFIPIHEFSLRRGCLIALAGALAVLLALPAATQEKSKRGSKKAAARYTPLTPRQRALHALNRLTFGPRPGDIEKVLATGVDAWIEQQLQPDRVDDGALEARLSALRTIQMKPSELAQAFPPDPLVRAVLTGQRPWPAEPMKRLLYAVQVERYLQQRQNEAVRKQGDGESATRMSGGNADAPAVSPAQERARLVAERLLALPKNQRMALVLETPASELVNFPAQIRPEQRDRLVADFSPEEREVFLALNNPANVPTGELQFAKILRAAVSERQLQEVMTDFWFNHFNVFLYKDADRWFTSSYERDVIRPLALGKFRDLLVATAKSPAMLFYLDGWTSAGAHSPAAERRGSNLGLNENYARELMELHTLGVDGGFTQADVTEVARVFTGWTISQPGQGGEYQFDANRHEPGPKQVLGQAIPEAGEAEGMQVLEMLAQHSSTANFIAKKLAQRFVADEPSEPLVRKMAARFQESGGDIREVLRTMFRSEEFWSRGVVHAKLKTPLEFVVSAIRATGTEVIAPGGTLQALQMMGMPPYGQQVPTGYSMKEESWNNTGALLARMNFASSLTSGKIGGLRYDPLPALAFGVIHTPDLPHAPAAKSPKHSGLALTLSILEEVLLGGEISPETEEKIRKELESPPPTGGASSSPSDTLRAITALLLGSPEFQRR